MMTKPLRPMPSQYYTDEDYQDAIAEYDRKVEDYERYEEYLDDRRKDREAERHATDDK